MTQYAYSFNEEEFFGPFDSVAEAIAEALSERERQTEGECPDIYIGTVVTPQEVLVADDNPSYIVTRILEMFDELLMDHIGSEDEVFSYPADKRDELGLAIIKLVLEYTKPKRFGVKDVCLLGEES